MKKCFFFLLTLGVLVPIGAGAATYYVAKTGSNSNSCAQAQNLSTPRLTIAAGVACMTSGDTLYIRAGTYSETSQSIIPPAGSAGAYTIISRYATETVTLPTQPFRVFNSSAAYLELNGFIWIGQGIAIGQGPHHIRIKNCEISGESGIAISIGNDDNLGSGNVEISRCKIHNNGTTGYDNAIYPSGSSNNVIEYNEIYSNAGAAIQLWSNGPSASNNIIRYNNIHDMTDQNGTKLQGIVVGKGDNNLVHDNMVYRLNSSVSGLCCGGIQITTGSTNAKIFNNTVYNTSTLGIYIDPTAGSGNTVKNNIAYQNTGGNIVNSASGSVLSNNLTVDPKFVNATGGDFHLQTGSPAIDSGVDLSSQGVTIGYDGTSRPQGCCYDIGAFEYATSSSIVAPTNLAVSP